MATTPPSDAKRDDANATTRSPEPAKLKRKGSGSLVFKERDLSKGQQAMRLALLWPVPQKGGKGKRSDFSERLGTGKGHAHNLISQKRTSPNSEKSAMDSDVIAFSPR